MNTFAITSLLACSLAIGCAGVVAGPTLSPDDSSKVLYFGRVDVGQPKTPRFSWPMTGFSVTFHGSQTVLGSFIFPSSGGRLRVIVDGATHGFVKQDGNNISGAMKQYTLAENLDAEKSHTLQVFKITEDNWKPCPSLKCPHHGMTFGGLQLDAGEFDSAPKALSRRLEFIGDSDTAGWCADGSPTSKGDAENTYEDAYVTWAQQLSRSLGAEAMVEAVSGWGVTYASYPIQRVSNLYGSFNETVKWDYSSWTPDAVVILSGPNDECSAPDWPHFRNWGCNKTDRWGEAHPASTGASFVEQYLQLMNMIVGNYSNATVPPKIIHVCGGSGNGLDPCKDIQEANSQFNGQQGGSGFKGYYTSITKENWNMINGPNGTGKSVYNGCDAHYSEKGHKVLADDILPQVQKIMGWDLTEDSIV